MFKYVQMPYCFSQVEEDVHQVNQNVQGHAEEFWTLQGFNVAGSVHVLGGIE